MVTSVERFFIVKLYVTLLSEADKATTNVVVCPAIMIVGLVAGKKLVIDTVIGQITFIDQVSVEFSNPSLTTAFITLEPAIAQLGVKVA